MSCGKSVAVHLCVKWGLDALVCLCVCVRLAITSVVDWALKNISIYLCVCVPAVHLYIKWALDAVCVCPHCAPVYIIGHANSHL